MTHMFCGAALFSSTVGVSAALTAAGTSDDFYLNAGFRVVLRAHLPLNL